MRTGAYLTHRFKCFALIDLPSPPLIMVTWVSLLAHYSRDVYYCINIEALIPCGLGPKMYCHISTYGKG